jgi:hypothetical protein
MMQTLHEGQSFMETALDYVTKLWPISVGFAGVIAWLVKIDIRSAQSAKNRVTDKQEHRDEIARVESRIENRRKEDMARLLEDMRELKVDIKNIAHEMTENFKTILQRGA